MSERYFCFGKQGICEEETCARCDFCDDEGGVDGETLDKIFKGLFGEEYDIDRLRELVQADREGRCVVLPVKLGDKVYRIMYRVNEETQKSEKCVDAGTVDFIQSVPDLFVSNGFVYKFTEIGKTVFLSREEAEAALKGENENGMDKR